MPPLSPKTLRVAGQALGLTDEAGDAIRQLSRPIRAYHGSPHSFDAFDASKIGTGFGAADFAVGHNFAELPEVADYYRRTLPGDGRVYEVAIDVPENRLLDYSDLLGGESGARAVAALRSRSPRGLSHRDLLAIERGVLTPGVGMGDMAAHPMKVLAAMEGVKALARTADGAELLLRHGVQGVRHADPTSLGQGTRNYVIFPGAEDRIRILRKYGLLAPMAAGAAMEEQ